MAKMRRCFTAAPLIRMSEIYQVLFYPLCFPVFVARRLYTTLSHRYDFSVAVNDEIGNKEEMPYSSFHDY